MREHCSDPVKNFAFIAVALGLVLGLAHHSCAQPAPQQSTHAEYVAMGSSFAAAPGVGNPAPGAPSICGRSDANYAHLLAKKRGLTLVDVTCSGAITEDILQAHHLTRDRSIPAQLDAVTAETKLVTITIGGNDLSYIKNLMIWSFASEEQNIPDEQKRHTATPVPQSEIAAELPGLEARLHSIVDGIHQRAPKAIIVFVDYTNILPATLPASGSCADKLPLTPDELEQGNAIAAQLAALTAKVAHDTGTKIFKASELTTGHDVCSSDPWVNSFLAPIAPYHPNSKAVNAIADGLDKALPRF